MGRPTRGSRLHEFYSELDSASDGQILSSLDSAFQLQEYISALVRADPHDVERIIKLPSKDDRDQEREDVEVDEACWIYEQLRRLALDLTYPLVDMLQHTCNRRSCPEMKAGEWLYLCVAHGSSGAMEQCCAIDYIIHTIDSATALLNSPRAFPSRLSIPASSRRHFPSLARRLGRIFAHAYFHHREGFAAAEAQNSLYARFLALCKRFDLVPAEFLVIPLLQDGNEHSENVRSSVVENGHGQDQHHQSTSISPGQTNIAILSRPSGDANASSAHADADGNSPGSSARQSRSPRNRLRTDTMYLSGTFHEVNSGISGANAGSEVDLNPRRVPSPLAATLASQEEEDEKAILTENRAPNDNAGVNFTDSTDSKDISPDQVTLIVPPSVPIIMSNAPPKILIRDFALESSHPTGSISQSSTDPTPDPDPDAISSTTISVPTVAMVIPPIVVNAPEVVISSVGENDITSSLPTRQERLHKVAEVSAEDEEEENADVDDLEHALENDDDEEGEEDKEEEEGNINMGMELPESDITSASAIEVRFEEIRPESEGQQGETKEQHEQERAEEFESSSLDDASTGHRTESRIDASEDTAVISHDTASDSTVNVDADITDTLHQDSEENIVLNLLEPPSPTESSADAKAEDGAEGFEHSDAEHAPNTSSTPLEDVQSQPTPTDESTSNPNQLNTEPLLVASSSDNTSTDTTSQTNEQEKIEQESEPSFRADSSPSETKSSEG